MIIEPQRETILNPEAQFPGGVWLDILAAPHGPEQRATMAKVRFQPGARTAWHSHARGQYLHVTDGIARFGDRDGNIIEVHPGQTLYTPPASSTGTPQHPAYSWNTLCSSRPMTVPPTPPGGASRSPTSNTKAAEPPPTPTTGVADQ
jgi:mannose-6-phosphate isomerase-like protein (cupin superfamily)